MAELQLESKWYLRRCGHISI